MAVTAYFLLLGIGLNTWLVRIPDFKNKFDLSAGTLGIILMIGALGTVIAIGPTGRYTARDGTAPIVRLGLVGFAGSLFVLSLASSIVFLAVAAFLVGASAAALDVAMNGHGVTVQKLIGRSVMSRFHATYSIGAFIAALLGGVVAQLSISLFWHLSLVALVMLVLGVGMMQYLLPGSADSHDFSSGSSSARSWPTIVWLLGLLGFAAALSEGAAGDWSAVHLREELGAAPFVASLGLTVFSFTMIIGRLAGDWITDRFSKPRLLLACGVISGAGLTVGLLSQSVVGMLIGWGLAGAGASIVIPVVWTLAGHLPGVPQAHAIALVTGITYSGFVVGPPIIGFIAEAVGLTSALYFVVALFLLIAAGSRITRA